VLLHQPDPVVTIRSAASAVRSGGIVAFHEVATHKPSLFQALPKVALFDRVATTVNAVYCATVQSPDVAGRLVECYTKAGLPSPQLFWECVVGDSASLIGRWLALSYCSMLSHIRQLDLEPDSIGDPETLVERLDAELRAVGAQVASNPQACGWAVRS
jgi:hypothetical protein